MTKTEKTIFIIVLFALGAVLFTYRNSSVTQPFGARTIDNDGIPVTASAPWYKIYNVPGSMVKNAVNVIPPTLPDLTYGANGAYDEPTCSLCTIFTGVKI
jgi:hypothetical protein